MRFARKGMLGFTVAACLVAVLPHAGASPATGTPVVELTGRGWGHGVGLAQWGAKHLADNGASHATILSTFYPGTELNTVEPRDVRVAVYTSPDGTARLTFPEGGEVRSAPAGEQAPGFPVAVAPGGSVVISFDGAAYHVTPVVAGQAAAQPASWSGRAAPEGCIPLFGPCPPAGGDSCPLGCKQEPAPPTTQPPPPPTDPSAPAPAPDPAAPGAGTPAQDPAAPPTDPAQAPPPPVESVSAAPIWAAPANGGATAVDARGRRYRGLLEATAAGGPLRLLNQVDVETYLMGMGEVPGTWPLEAIAAQTVAARTYALRAMSFSGELCDYDLCQVYLGANAETAGQTAAVEATRGEVVSYGGALASTVYSADAGGVTASTFEGFGTADGTYPYLTVVRYDVGAGLPWNNEVALTDVASRFGYGGEVTGVAVSQPGPSGRALQVTIDGSAGPVQVDGRTFASRLGLRSTLFTTATGLADGVPPPPPSPTNLQTLPEDAAAIRKAAAGDPTPGDDVTLASAFDASTADAADARPVRSGRDLAQQPVVWAMLLVLGLATIMGMSQLDGARLRFATLANDPPWWWPDRAPRPGRANAEQRFWGSLAPDDTGGWDDLFADGWLSPWSESESARASSTAGPQAEPVRPVRRLRPITRPTPPPPMATASQPGSAGAAQQRVIRLRVRR